MATWPPCRASPHVACACPRCGIFLNDDGPAGASHEWGTALGCAALTLDLLATYLAAPQLHHLAFQVLVGRLVDTLSVSVIAASQC